MAKNNIYSSIYSNLLKQLQSPIYQVGDEIPSAAKLAEQYSVSRPTIHKALKQLQHEGLIASKVGSGTVILKKPECKKKTPLFGLIFPLLRMGSFFENIAKEIAKLSDLFDFQLIWGGQFPQGSIDLTSLEQLSNFYIKEKVAGVFMAPVELTSDCYKTNKMILQKLNKAHIPVTIIDAGITRFPENIQKDIITIDNYRAGYTLANYMLTTGKSNRIDFCTLPYVGRTVQLRQKGIESALLDHGIVPKKEWTHILTKEDQLAINLRNLGASNIICSNDFVAIKLQRILQKKSYDIPKDFRIASFDGSNEAKEIFPSITTIIQPCDELAFLAVKNMLNRIAYPDMPISQTITNFKLLIGEST